MTLAAPVEPIEVDDLELRGYLDDAHIPSLLATLAHITGDLSILRPDLQGRFVGLVQPQGGLSAAQVEEATALAFDVLKRYRDSGCKVAPYPRPDELRKIVEYMAGGVPIDDYMAMMDEELALTGNDSRAPNWRKEELAPDRDFAVAVIGAGMSGIVTAYRLKQAGVPFIVFEKNSDIGGTWYENTYPGCRVDIANHYYSYSFAQRDWPQWHSTQSELERYFSECVDQFEIRPHIRFDTEVESVVFDDDSASWSVNVTKSGETSEEFRFQAVISAVGQLNQPYIPQIEGRETFSGDAFHSARWDHNVSLMGKRVAVIGTGCSAVQFAPIVAGQAAHLEVFQRTPNWMRPDPNYHGDVPEGFQWLLRHIPHYRQWYRFYLFWSTAETFRPVAEVDPDWLETASVGPANEGLRKLLSEAMAAQYEDRPDLLEKVLPAYPPCSKRLIVDGGHWGDMLRRDNVDLITDRISRIVPEGLITADGAVHPADVIIFGTGFQAARFLTPMRVVGRGGIDLHDLWRDDDARAYLGLTVPDFPNFLMIYGPNTNLVVSGSITLFSECAANYVSDYIRRVFSEGIRGMDLRSDVYADYNRKIDEANKRLVWAVSSVNSWYKNSQGRSTQNWPFALVDYWRMTRSVDPADYEAI
jgi:4-hydroxyacetophenone monooxygenase